MVFSPVHGLFAAKASAHDHYPDDASLELVGTFTDINNAPPTITATSAAACHIGGKCDASAKSHPRAINSSR